jgi:hypothetical protein
MSSKTRDVWSAGESEKLPKLGTPPRLANWEIRELKIENLSDLMGILGLVPWFPYCYIFLSLRYCGLIVGNMSNVCKTVVATDRLSEKAQ